MNMFSKYGVWNLTAYARVLYVDLDAYVLRPLHALWATQLSGMQVGAAALTIGNSGAPKKHGNWTRACSAGNPFTDSAGQARCAESATCAAQTRPQLDRPLPASPLDRT